MEIRIREVPDKILRLTFPVPSSNQWFKQNPPAEYWLGKVGSVNVFVKRQKKEFTGWGLLINAISDRQIRNTPRIVSVARNLDFNYYFSERLDGRTLEDDLRKKTSLNFFSSSARLIDSLEDINSRGYWFSDLCKKNIFVCKRGDANLIDLDSCLPHVRQLDPDLKVSFDYKALIPEFIKRTSPAGALNLRQLSGECINQAEMVALAVDISKKFTIPPNKRSEVFHGILNQPKTKKLYLKLFKSLVSNERDWALTRELIKIIGE
jgi:hypothetical protein